MWTVKARAVSASKYNVIATYTQTAIPTTFVFGPIEITRTDIPNFIDKAIMALERWKAANAAIDITTQMENALNNATP